MKTNFEEYSDAELFELLSKDNRTGEKAFAEIYSRYANKVYAFCRRFLGNREEAQDVFQETFIKFHQCRGQKRDMTNMSSFLLTIARNICVNHLRREKRNDVSFEEYMVSDYNNTYEKDELLNILKSALALLPDDYREAFILREYDGFSYQEIAEIIGESLSNVKIRIYRAKNRLREILEPYLKDLSKY